MNQRQLKAALFDLDGVVFNTEQQYTVFWGDMCRKYHPELPGLEYEIKGSTLDQIYDRWWNGQLKKKRQEVTDALNAFEAEMSYEYVEGLESFVADLRRNGMKTAVVTSSNRPKMENVYRKRPDFLQLFDAVLTSEDFAESKPSPDCYLRGASSLGALPNECVVLEDSINGLKSGWAAGMFVVGLLTTNTLDAVATLSHCQITNYNNFNYHKLKQLWQAI